MDPYILVIDDDRGICDLIRSVLEDDGYAVEAAVDGAALLLAHSDPPALILLDLMMPVLDGYAMGQRLREDPVTAPIPIIVMSAADEGQAAAAHLGAVDYLPKPFDLEHLSALVATYAR